MGRSYKDNYRFEKYELFSEFSIILVLIVLVPGHCLPFKLLKTNFLTFKFTSTTGNFSYANALHLTLFSLTVTCIHRRCICVSIELIKADDMQMYFYARTRLLMI